MNEEFESWYAKNFSGEQLVKGMCKEAFEAGWEAAQTIEVAINNLSECKHESSGVIYDSMPVKDFCKHCGVDLNSL